jgi:hypothetical protein
MDILNVILAEQTKNLQRYRQVISCLEKATQLDGMSIMFFRSVLAAIFSNQVCNLSSAED